jgi:hypothetical protein
MAMGEAAGVAAAAAAAGGRDVGALDTAWLRAELTRRGALVDRAQLPSP